ncbi:MAG: DUF1501 domain-containing protein [Methylocapsa sp.]|nr:DUF1501 domain-containing protein [Methylocapsa sp.]
MATYCEAPSPSRRTLLRASGALFAWAHLPRFAKAAGSRDPRLAVIILRGALDGLSAVGPAGDPDYASLHGALALSHSGDHPALPLDGFFALNPAMQSFARLFREGKAAVVHAVATPYRERSHFDGQDVLESGYPSPGRTDSGWLNRALASLPAGERLRGLGIGAVAPLVMRGPAPVLGWAPQALPQAGDDLARRVLDLYTHRDPALASALREGLATEQMASAAQLVGEAARPSGGMRQAAAMRQTAMGAARLMAADDGPRIAALAFDGFDTHANEGGASGQLAARLLGLDGAFGEFERGLGEKWQDTVLIAITEFGRTAKINGTSGTDHGTGTVAFLAGGALKGGRVIVDWPGLKEKQLYEGRDLAPTTDLRAVLKGLLADHLGLSSSVLATKVFPNSASVKPLPGLIG